MLTHSWRQEPCQWITTLECRGGWHGQVWLMSRRMQMTSIDLQKQQQQWRAQWSSDIFRNPSQMIVIQLISFNPGQFSWSLFVKLLDIYKCASSEVPLYHTHHKILTQCSDLWLLVLSFSLAHTGFNGVGNHQAPVLIWPNSQYSLFFWGLTGDNKWACLLIRIPMFQIQLLIFATAEHSWQISTTKVWNREEPSLLLTPLWNFALFITTLWNFALLQNSAATLLCFVDRERGAGWIAAALPRFQCFRQRAIVEQPGMNGKKYLDHSSRKREREKNKKERIVRGTGGYKN